VTLQGGRDAVDRGDGGRRAGEECVKMVYRIVVDCIQVRISITLPPFAGTRSGNFFYFIFRKR
jgi:hypothetical protein